MSNSTPVQLPLPLENATVTIPLTKGYLTIIDAVDSDLIQYKWRAKPDKYTTYVQRNSPRIAGKQYTIFLHTVIYQRLLGRSLGEGETVDHKDGNALNNRRSNLRLATQSQQNGNRRKSKNNHSGFKGVEWNKHDRKWRARIQIQGKRLFLGLYDTPELAYRAYCEAALEHFGEFARLK